MRMYTNHFTLAAFVVGSEVSAGLVLATASRSLENNCAMRWVGRRRRRRRQRTAFSCTKTTEKNNIKHSVTACQAKTQQCERERCEYNIYYYYYECRQLTLTHSPSLYPPSRPPNDRFQVHSSNTHPNGIASFSTVSNKMRSLAACAACKVSSNDVPVRLIGSTNDDWLRQRKFIVGRMKPGQIQRQYCYSNTYSNCRHRKVKRWQNWTRKMFVHGFGGNDPKYR